MSNRGTHSVPYPAEIVANNPQAKFLKEITPILEKGGTVTVRGHIGNKFFKGIYKETAAGMSKFKVIHKTPKGGSVPNLGYVNNKGKPLGGNFWEIVLEKL